MIGCFIALACCLIVSGAMPIANGSRSKAEKANIALALAQKQIEKAKSLGFPNATAARAFDNGMLDSLTVVDLHSAMLFGTASYPAYESTWVDDPQVDSAGKLLPYGRSFLTFSEINPNLRAVEVIVFWQEGSTTRFVKLGALLANL